MYRFRLLALACLGLALMFGAAALPGRAADHRDAPLINQDPTADINDVYAFVNPANPNNVVLAVTVNPFVVPGVGATFSPEVLYQFKIDNTGDALEDLVIQGTFSTHTASGSGQTFSVRGPSRPLGPRGTTNLLLRGSAITGPANATAVTGDRGITVAAGIYDDPFFFDLVWVFRDLGILSGGPLSRNPGIDFFAGINTSILIVDVPSSLLRGSLGNTIRVWATTSRAKTTRRSSAGDRNSSPYIQLERMGLPVINTVLVGRQQGTAQRKDFFNRTAPNHDRRNFYDEAIRVLEPLSGDRRHAEHLLSLLMPDTLILDTGKLTGFDELNGRRPQDDVIDKVLTEVRNRPNGDNVNANDVPFPTGFPFFAPAHLPSEGVPPRN